MHDGLTLELRYVDDGFGGKNQLPIFRSILSLDEIYNTVEGKGHQAYVSEYVQAQGIGFEAFLIARQS